MYCPECGTEVPNNAKFCGGCSYQFNPGSQTSSEYARDEPISASDIDTTIEPVSNGLKFGILGTSLVLPIVGIVMGGLYLVKGENDVKKAVGKLWLIVGISIGVLYLLSASGGY